MITKENEPGVLHECPHFLNVLPVSSLVMLTWGPRLLSCFFPPLSMPRACSGIRYNHSGHRAPASPVSTLCASQRLDLQLPSRLCAVSLRLRSAKAGDQ